MEIDDCECCHESTNENNTEPPNKPKCCFSSDGYCFYAPEGACKGKCYYKSNEFDHKISITASNFKYSSYTGGEQTAVGLAGGGNNLMNKSNEEDSCCSDENCNDKKITRIENDTNGKNSCCSDEECERNETTDLEKNISKF